LWELAKLVQLGRLDMDLDGAAFAVCLSRITVVPISAGIATASTRLDFASIRGNYSRSDFAAAGVISRPRASWST